jgi:cytochrome c oxidase subunit 4
MNAPIVSLKTYALVWGALLCLTLITTLIALVDLGPFTMLIAIGIATLKASLIASIFMHALFEAKLVKVVIAGAVVWFLIMMSLTLVDYATRGWTPVART